MDSGKGFQITASRVLLLLAVIIFVVIAVQGGAFWSIPAGLAALAAAFLLP